MEPSIRAWAGFSRENIPIDSLFVAKEQSNRSKKKKKNTQHCLHDIERERERERLTDDS